MSDYYPCAPLPVEGAAKMDAEKEAAMAKGTVLSVDKLTVARIGGLEATFKDYSHLAVPGRHDDF